MAHDDPPTRRCGGCRMDVRDCECDFERCERCDCHFDVCECCEDCEGLGYIDSYEGDNETRRYCHCSAGREYRDEIDAIKLDRAGGD